ncbi:MAG: sodium:calcium antiporter [Myxococcaceae bacterium]|nr:sodium:calcium antiporter [Myxococcaceae bacterium]
MIHVLAFLAAGLVVVFAGTALARYGDAIAEATKVGRLWIGSVLLAGATSLPELATDISAVRLGAVDLAVGDLFGSSMANMLILALIDLLPPRRRVLQQVNLDHALSVALAISVNALAAVFILVRPEFTILGISPGSVLLVLAYVLGTRAIYRHVTREGATLSMGLAQEEGPSKLSLRQALLGFGGASAVILVSAPLFAWGAKGIAEMTGLGNTFVGTWLVGLSTSLPELVASVAAVRMGAFDMAVGNLFGSNAFNMAILFPLDLAQRGSLFAAVDPSHVLSALFGVILMALGLAAIAYRAQRRFAMLEPDSLLVLAAYVLGIWLLYLHAVP